MAFVFKKDRVGWSPPCCNKVLGFGERFANTFRNCLWCILLFHAPIQVTLLPDAATRGLFRPLPQLLRTYQSEVALAKTLHSAPAPNAGQDNLTFCTSNLTTWQLFEKSEYWSELTGLPMEIMVSTKAGFDENTSPRIRVYGTYERDIVRVGESIDQYFSKCRPPFSLCNLMSDFANLPLSVTEDWDKGF